MFKSLLTKTLFDKRWFLFGWALGAVMLFVLTAAFYPLVAESIGDLMKSIPPALSSIVGETGAYASYPGYLASAVFGIRAEMLFVPLGIILGLGLGVNEELSRRMYQLLAQPLSRRAIVLQKWLAGALIIFAIIAAVFVSIVTTSILIGEGGQYELMVEIAFMSLLLTLAVFSLSFGVGMATGSRSLAIVVPVVWVMASLLLDSLGAQIDWIKAFDWLSLMKYYDTGSLVKESLQAVDIVVLAGVSLISLGSALVAFPGRDIKEAE